MTGNVADGRAKAAEARASAPEPGAGADALDALSAPGAKEREAAVERLTGDPRPAVVGAVGRLAAEDPNANVRRTAAKVLGSLGPAAIEPLTTALAKGGEESFVRRAAAQSLGRVGGDAAVPSLRQAASGGDDELAGDCIRALGAVHTPAATAALAGLAGPAVLRRDWLVAAVVTELGASGGTDDQAAIAALRPLVGTATGRVAKALATAVVTLRPPDTVAVLEPLLHHDDAGVRARAAQSLKAIAATDAGAVTALVAALIDDEDARVRQEAATALAACPPSQALVGAIVDGLGTSPADRSSLDAATVAMALAPAVASADYGRDRVADVLIAAALGAGERLVGVVAVVLVACCGRDATVAGDLVNRYAEAHAGSEEELQQLRVEIGGTRALDPLFVRLQENLQEYFQKPIHELNTRTQQSWQEAVERARLAFMIRIVMSAVVFVVGVVLVLASAAAFIFGDLDTTQAWGTGGTLAGGVGAMLAITYTGPLKDVRLSVRDLASATTAFIGYVHQVLQVSHTFSSCYLQGRMTYADLERSSQLLSKATQEAVALLAPDEPAKRKASQ